DGLQPRSTLATGQRSDGFVTDAWAWLLECRGCAAQINDVRFGDPNLWIRICVRRLAKCPSALLHQAPLRAGSALVAASRWLIGRVAQGRTQSSSDRKRRSLFSGV